MPYALQGIVSAWWGAMVCVLIFFGHQYHLHSTLPPRVDAVQHALVSFTGVSAGEQILMCHGARLDPSKPLSAYKLPVVMRARARVCVLCLRAFFGNTCLRACLCVAGPHIHSFASPLLSQNQINQ
jgi:hypothetical protein